MPPEMWNSRRILRELADAPTRKRILTDFWKFGEPSAKAIAGAHLAKALHFREETIRKLPADKKAEMLASRLGSAELDQFFEMALMQYHTHEANDMMSAFLDQWKIPHQNGSIEGEDYKAPDETQVREAVTALREAYEPQAIAIYLASAGLLMGWEGVWPVVDELRAADES